MADMAVRSSLSGLRVLLVDDDVDSGEFLTLGLELYRIEVHFVRSAREALEAFVRLRPDILISDIAMPGEDGYSLIRKITQLEASQTRTTPAIAVTALPDDRWKALSMGYDAFLRKPIDLKVLIDTIAELAVHSRLSA